MASKIKTSPISKSLCKPPVKTPENATKSIRTSATLFKKSPVSPSVTSSPGSTKKLVTVPLVKSSSPRSSTAISVKPSIQKTAENPKPKSPNALRSPLSASKPVVATMVTKVVKPVISPKPSSKLTVKSAISPDSSKIKPAIKMTATKPLVKPVTSQVIKKTVSPPLKPAITRPSAKPKIASTVTKTVTKQSMTRTLIKPVSRPIRPRTSGPTSKVSEDIKRFSNPTVVSNDILQHNIVPTAIVTHGADFPDAEQFSLCNCDRRNNFDEQQAYKVAEQMMEVIQIQNLSPESFPYDIIEVEKAGQSENAEFAIGVFDAKDHANDLNIVENHYGDSSETKDRTFCSASAEIKQSPNLEGIELTEIKIVRNSEEQTEFDAVENSNDNLEFIENRSTDQQLIDSSNNDQRLESNSIHDSEKETASCQDPIQNEVTESYTSANDYVVCENLKLNSNTSNTEYVPKSKVDESTDKSVISPDANCNLSQAPARNQRSDIQEHKDELECVPISRAVSGDTSSTSCETKSTSDCSGELEDSLNCSSNDDQDAEDDFVIIINKEAESTENKVEAEKALSPTRPTILLNKQESVTQSLPDMTYADVVKSPKLTYSSSTSSLTSFEKLSQTSVELQSSEVDDDGFRIVRRKKSKSPTKSEHVLPKIELDPKNDTEFKSEDYEDFFQQPHQRRKWPKKSKFMSKRYFKELSKCDSDSDLYMVPVWKSLWTRDD